MGAVRKIGSGLFVAGALLLGANVPGASAYAISGGSYAGTAARITTFSAAGGFVVTCPAAVTTFDGVATGWPVTYFRPNFGVMGDCAFYGLPAGVTQSGSWGLTVTGGPSVGGFYSGEFHIPVSTTTTIEVPSSGCTVTITGTQNVVHGSSGDIVGAANLSGATSIGFDVANVAYTASGCPFASGSDGAISTSFVAPGITVS